jgi:leader peptidase (prepilin peptidase) / N-methyltransferase
MPMPYLMPLQDDPSVFIAVCVIIGLMIGSFLNVVIYRLPKIMERTWLQQCAELRGEKIEPLPIFNIASPRSMCPSCGHKISVLKNIPIISYLFLGGRCSQCHAKISIRYPMIEAFTSIISGYIAWHFGFSLITIAALIFTWAMITLAMIDLDTQLLPDDITLPLLWLGLLVNLNGGFTDIRFAIIGAAAGYLFLWLVFWIFKLATGKEGIGYGDFKLLAAIGAWFGWSMLPLVILFSSLVGAIIGVGIIAISKEKSNVPIPFGPFLAIAALIALFWGNQLNHMYLAQF